MSLSVCADFEAASTGLRVEEGGEESVGKAVSAPH